MKHAEASATGNQLSFTISGMPLCSWYHHVVHTGGFDIVQCIQPAACNCTVLDGTSILKESVTQVLISGAGQVQGTRQAEGTIASASNLSAPAAAKLFLASDCFDGKKSGYVFMLGAFGVGYYRDMQ